MPRVGHLPTEASRQSHFGQRDCRGGRLFDGHGIGETFWKRRRGVFSDLASGRCGAGVRSAAGSTGVAGNFSAAFFQQPWSGESVDLYDSGSCGNDSRRMGRRGVAGEVAV